MACSCRSEKGYVYSPHSWNENDTKGLFIFFLIIVIIGIILSLCIDYQTNMIWFLIIGIVILFSVVCYRPILLLYAPSCLLSMFINTTPILNRKKYFPNHTRFEDPNTFQSIKHEIDVMLEQTDGGNTLPLTQDSYSGENKYIGSDVKMVQGKKRAWRILNIKAGSSYSKEAQHFPTLVGILESLPEVKSCVISVLEPGIRIPIHVGYYKGIMRYMLPTHIPKDRKNVFLCVNGISHHWKEGHGVLWDDTFAHKVYNNTNEARVLIYMDVLRPFRNKMAHQWNEWFIDKAMQTSIVQDEIKRTEIQVAI
jgi:hypothetical protein